MVVVYVATWQHYEDFAVLDVFLSPEDAMQYCRDEAEKDADSPPILGEFEHSPGWWHGVTRQGDRNIGYFIYEKVVR